MEFNLGTSYQSHDHRVSFTDLSLAESTTFGSSVLIKADRTWPMGELTTISSAASKYLLSLTSFISISLSPCRTCRETVPRRKGNSPEFFSAHSDLCGQKATLPASSRSARMRATASSRKRARKATLCALHQYFISWTPRGAPFRSHISRNTRGVNQNLSL